MGTEILKSFGVLQSELEQAKSTLKGYDENIKRLIGRDPSELITRPGIKRGPPIDENNKGRQRIALNRVRNFNHENDEPIPKRRNTSVFKRLSDRPSNYEEEIIQQTQKQMISKVIVTPREVPSRQEALAAQNTDEKSKARNRRMFGALMGTLQKFQQEQTKLKSREQKRAQVEKKIEEHEIREKAEIKKEKQELFFNRKKKQAEIKMIELKMNRMREYTVWEERQKPRVNFIHTKTKPHICYLPKKLNEASAALLENSRIEVQNIIEKRKQEVFTELEHIEERMKRNFESKKSKVVVHEEEIHNEDLSKELQHHNLNITEDNEVADTSQLSSHINNGTIIKSSIVTSSDKEDIEEEEVVKDSEQQLTENMETNREQSLLPLNEIDEEQCCLNKEEGDSKPESD